MTKKYAIKGVHLCREGIQPTAMVFEELIPAFVYTLNLHSHNCSFISTYDNQFLFQFRNVNRIKYKLP